MMRPSEYVQLIGHPEPPLPDFETWLRGEIDQAEQIDKKFDDRIMTNNRPQPRLASVAAAYARLRALHEVALAYDRSRHE